MVGWVVRAAVVRHQLNELLGLVEIKRVLCGIGCLCTVESRRSVERLSLGSAGWCLADAVVGYSVACGHR